MSEVIAAAPVSSRSSHGGRVDASRAPDERTATLLPASIGFLASHRISPGILLAAMDEARRTGAEPVAALIAGGLVEESVYYRALGRHLSLPYEEADGIEIRPGSHYPESILSGVVPVRLPSGRDGWMIAPSARRIEDLLRLARLGRLPRQHLLLTRPSALAAAVRVHHAAQVARLASHSLADGDERLSARTEATGWQKATASLFAVMVLFALTYGGLPWAAFCGLCGIILAAAILLRIFATAASFDPVGRRPRALADRELPFYTVSIALCREEEVLDQLIAAMEALDYPAAKVEIKLIVEADDAGLIAAIAARSVATAVVICRRSAGTLSARAADQSG